jgi:hypothetical protein
MAATITTLDSILKEFYVGPIREQIAQEANVRGLFKEMTVSWQGKRAVVPLHVSRNTGVGAIAESGTLPTAGNQGFDQLDINAKFVYGRFQVTGPAMASARSNAGAFATYVGAELDKLAEDVANVENQFAVHGGRVMGFVWQKQNGATFEYAGRISTTELALQLGNATDTAQLVRLDTYAAVGASTRVNTVTEASIVFNAAIDTTAVPAGVVLAVVITSAVSTILGGVAGNALREPLGITSNLADPTAHGADRTTATGAPELQSNFLLIDPVNDVYASLDLKRMQAALDTLSEQGVDPDLILTHPAMRAEYTDLLVGVNAANLYVDSDKSKKKGDAGFAGGLGYNDKPIMTSRHAHKGTFVFLRKKDWGMYELEAGGFMDKDGALLSRVPNTDAYEGTWKHYYDVACSRPNAQCILTGISF